MNGKNHWVAVHPVTGVKIIFPGTPSDPRWKAIVEVKIRRAAQGLAYKESRNDTTRRER